MLGGSGDSIVNKTDRAQTHVEMTSRHIHVTSYLSNSLIIEVSKIYEGVTSSKMLLSYTFSFLINQTLMKPSVPRSDSHMTPLHILFERMYDIPCLTSSPPFIS